MRNNTTEIDIDKETKINKILIRFFTCIGIAIMIFLFIIIFENTRKIIELETKVNTIQKQINTIQKQINKKPNNKEGNKIEEKSSNISKV